MTTLNSWLEQATRCLSKDSAAQVRTEIQQHYESEREAAMGRGLSAEEASRLALVALGDPKSANRDYRKVLLTSEEARMLRDGNGEARAVCSNRWLKWTLLSAPGVALLAAAACFLGGAHDVARGLALGSIALALFFVAPFLPLYTVARARVYRFAKWSTVALAMMLIVGPDEPQYSWLLVCLLWIPVVEMRRAAIRRKLPVGEWPKQLYL